MHGFYSRKNALIKKRLPLLLMLDIHLPDIDGFSACRRLKSDPLTKDIPVIFLSKDDDAKERRETYAAGGADYLIAPFVEAEVVVCFKTQLDHANHH